MSWRGLISWTETCLDLSCLPGHPYFPFSFSGVIGRCALRLSLASVPFCSLSYMAISYTANPLGLLFRRSELTNGVLSLLRKQATIGGLEMAHSSPDRLENAIWSGMWDTDNPQGKVVAQLLRTSLVVRWGNDLVKGSTNDGIMLQVFCTKWKERQCLQGRWSWLDTAKLFCHPAEG